MTRLSLRARTFRLVAASVAALVVAIPALLGVTLNAQTVTEVWQVVLSIPTIPSSGLPSVTSPSPSLDFPFGITTDSSGNILVADSYNNLVRRFDPGTGAETLTIGTTSGGSGDSQFYNPQDVIVDTSGNILVTDGGGNRVSVFDTNGTAQFRVGSYTNPVTGQSETFGWPWGVAMTAGTTVSAPGTCAAGGSGRIAVVNSYVSGSPLAGTTGDVAVFDSCFTPLFMLGMPTTGAAADSVLSSPIAVEHRRDDGRLPGDRRRRQPASRGLRQHGPVPLLVRVGIPRRAPMTSRSTRRAASSSRTPTASWSTSTAST